MQYRLISIVLVILCSFAAQTAVRAQEVIYVIRHAEQALDVEDPPLTDVGQQRAKVWAKIFRDAGLDVIYTSNKRRTLQTGKYVAQALNVPLETMPRRDVAGLVDRLRTHHAGDAVLIVSHTRTIPKLVKALAGLEDGTIERGDYDNLFIIVPRGQNVPAVVHLHYQ